jgi:hypothetical protein
MDQEQLYRRLDILDNKCSALLQLSSVVLALNVIPAVITDTSGLALTLTIVVVSLFLLSSVLALSVIWVNWSPTERTLTLRSRTYRVALVATGLGVFAMAARVIEGMM